MSVPDRSANLPAVYELDLPQSTHQNEYKFARNAEEMSADTATVSGHSADETGQSTGGLLDVR